MHLFQGLPSVDIEQTIKKINKRKRQSGFTFIELVITTVIIGILFAMIMNLVSFPIQSYVQASTHAVLVDQAESALRRIERDLSRAVPNSIRVKNGGGNSAVEMLNAVEGARYRSQGPGTINSTVLDLTIGQAYTDFNILGNFQYAKTSPTTDFGYRLVIYNTGAYGANMDSPLAGANVWSTSLTPNLGLAEQNPPAGTSVITLPPPSPASPATKVLLTTTGTSEDHINITPGFQFAFDSPQNRIYVVDSPISYVWDPVAQTITRYAGYTINSIQPNDGSAAPLSAASSVGLLTQNVTNCVFNYIPGTAQRNSVLIISLTLSNNGATVTLLHEVTASNNP